MLFFSHVILVDYNFLINCNNHFQSRNPPVWWGQRPAEVNINRSCRTYSAMLLLLMANDQTSFNFISVISKTLKYLTNLNSSNYCTDLPRVLNQHAGELGVSFGSKLFDDKHLLFLHKSSMSSRSAVYSLPSFWASNPNPAADPGALCFKYVTGHCLVTIFCSYTGLLSPLVAPLWIRLWPHPSRTLSRAITLRLLDRFRRNLLFSDGLDKKGPLKTNSKMKSVSKSVH